MNVDMKYRQCGASDLKLSVLGLGCWTFGGGQYWGNQDQSDVNDVVHAAVDCGINYFDTAEAYNEGRSESSLAIAMQGLKRDEIIIGSKVTPANCYPGVLEEHCEASLRRLDTDYIDLYMLHWPIHPHSIKHFTKDPAVIGKPPEIGRTFEILARLKQSGKIRHVGISNFSAGRMKEDIPSNLAVAANQLPYNLLCRAVEFDAMASCKENGIGIISYMTLLQGILAGKYPTLAEVPEWQRRTRHFDSSGSSLCRHGEAGFEDETDRAIKAIKAVASANKVDMAELAIRWAVENTNIGCALVGARNRAQLNANVHALAIEIDPDVMEKLNSVTEPLKQQLGNHLDLYESAENDRTL
jgi:myo-inositol catabolism protein IolS